MNKDPESWARVSPEAVLSGSPAQARNVLEMALQDIAAMALEIKALRRLAAETKALRRMVGRPAPAIGRKR